MERSVRFWASCLIHVQGLATNAVAHSLLVMSHGELNRWQVLRESHEARKEITFIHHVCALEE